MMSKRDIDTANNAAAYLEHLEGLLMADDIDMKLPDDVASPSSVAISLRLYAAYVKNLEEKVEKVAIYDTQRTALKVINNRLAAALDSILEALAEDCTDTARWDELIDAGVAAVAAARGEE